MSRFFQYLLTGNGRVSFDGSDMSQSVFSNAVLSGTTFTDANLQDTDFSHAYLGKRMVYCALCNQETLDIYNCQQ